MIWRVAFLLALGALPADAACRQALALGLDISGSVDEREYRLQLDGVATALERPAVRRALFAMPGAPVSLAVYEWSEPGQMRLTLDWTALEGPADLTRATGVMRAATRPDFPPSTGLGAALQAGADLLAQRGDCWQRALDISGDGRSNTGPRPRQTRQTEAFADITINALVIGADDVPGGDARQAQIADLSAYFRAEVIHGPNAFIETALGFEDYADAMERKLLRELQVLVLGVLPAPGRQ